MTATGELLDMAEIDMTEESGQPIKDGEYGVFNDMNNAIDAAYIAQKNT